MTKQAAAYADVGATVAGPGTRFEVWAPHADVVEVVLEGPARTGLHTMRREADGLYALTIDGVGDGDRYRYRVDGNGPFADPASRFQPTGPHGPSQVIDWTRFAWRDADWAGLSLEDAIIYELHVGAFTPEGTFASAAARLPDLADLGVTAVELMPVADFPGRRNWGYDGVAPFAPAHAYGTPDDLRRLVDDAHGLGVAVFLDVVYNHLGPDGAYQGLFSPFYYSATHTSPWGASINFDGPGSGRVRGYVIQNALRWIREFHIDGLRLDATHAIVDESRRHLLAELSAAVRESLQGSRRRALVIAEDHRNLSAMVRPESGGGWGLDAVWSDDFHHEMRRALAGDADGYFQDFDGSVDAIAATARRGWFFTGQHSPWFGGPRGTDPAGVPPPAFVFFLQNHDQIGNRAFGERLHHEIDPAVSRAAAILLLVLPETPLLFMGQEWAASAPFLYFTDHEPELGRLVTEGRRREFAKFAAFSSPGARERIPDPQSEQTFLSSRLDWSERVREPHASVLRLYARMLGVRRTDPSLRYTADEPWVVTALGADALQVWRASTPGEATLAVVRLHGAGRVQPRIPASGGDRGFSWCLTLTTEDAAFAPDARPPAIDLDPPGAAFARPGAVLFKGRRRDSKEGC